MIAGIQLAAWRADLISLVSPSKLCATGAEVKCSRSLRQFALMTARVSF
jgi:hypothetical protein